MIYSASAVSSAQSGGNPYKYLIKQLLALAAGGAAAFAVYRTDYRKFAKPWVGYLTFGLAWLLCVGALFRPPINNARRWLSLGPVMLQPSEMLKIGLALVLASILARKVQTTGDPERAIVASLVFTALASGVVLLEPDMGTAVCYVMVCAVLFWLSGIRARFFAIGAAGLIPVIVALAFSADYRRARIMSFMHPESDPLGAGFQALQSLIAVGAGGFSGNGLGGGRQKLFFLPYPHTDFIFAIVGEELGFVGALAMVACFGVVAWRGLRAARTGARRLRLLPRGRRDRDDRGAGRHQPLRRAGPRPHEGDPASVRLVRRLVPRRVLDRGGADPERLAARGGARGRGEVRGGRW